MRLLYLSLLTAFVSGQTIPDESPVDSSLVDNDHSPVAGITIKYTLKYQKKWPHCSNIKCIHNVISSHMVNQCNLYGDCTGFSFSHGVGNGKGWGCLKKCGTREFGGYGSYTHDYWEKKPSVPGATCKYDFVPYYDSDGNDIHWNKTNDPDILTAMCSMMEKCTCFNTNGWLKYKTRPRSEWTKWTSDKSKGLYLKNCSAPGRPVIPPPPPPPPKTYVTDWWYCFNDEKWCKVTHGYMTGLYRSANPGGSKDEIFRLEEASSADAPSYLAGASTCYNHNWWYTFNKKGWSKCNPGYYLKGMFRTKRAGHQGLHNIEEGNCCKPVKQGNAWGACYVQDVRNTFNKAGWSKCKPGYYMSGMWRTDCDNLYCIESFYCCKMGAKAEEDIISEE